MTRPHDAEVPAIERRDHGRIDRPERKFGIAATAGRRGTEPAPSKLQLRGCGTPEWRSDNQQAMTALTDSELIERSISDPEQFVAVFDRHFSVVHRFLRVRGDRVADDLAAETFAIAFGRRSEYDAAHPDARAWLFGIAVNLLRTHWRSERRKLAAFARLGGEPELDASHAAIERMDAHSAVASLRGVLDTLRPEDRDLLLLHACVGLTYEEVADALAIPSGTVRSRLHRLRTRLRDRLAEVERQRTETCG